MFLIGRTDYYSNGTVSAIKITYLLCRMNHVLHSSASMESTKNGVSKQVVVLDKALKLAEEWVKQMKMGTDTAEGAIDEVEIQNRPARLGFRAKFLPLSQFASPLNPIEKKLREKLDAAKRQAALDIGRLSSVERENRSRISKCENVVDDDDNSDSRTNAFNKK